MELTATAVHWDHFTEAANSGSLTEILFEDVEYSKELEYADTPWPSDSSHEYLEVALQVSKAAESSEQWRLITHLINEDMELPCEIEDIDPEVIAGALSPDSVTKYSVAFERIDLSQIDAPANEYLNQWKAMLSFARSKSAGVYFHHG